MCGLRESKNSGLISRALAWMIEWPSFIRKYNGFSCKEMMVFEKFVEYAK